MKFTTHAGDLHAALTLANRVIPKSPSLSVFSGVLLQVKGGRLEVTGSAEGETTVTVTVTVTGAEPGSAVLLPKPLVVYLHTLPATATVTVRAEADTKVTVTADGGNPYTFRSMDATFPVAASGKSDRRTADLSRLSAAVPVIRSSSKDTGIVQLVSDDEGLRLHATDGLRLSRAHLPEGGFGPFSGLLRLPVLEQIAEANPTELRIDRAGRVMTASSESVTIVTRLVESMFPPVDTILDHEPPQHATVIGADLTGALARLASVRDDKHPLIVTVGGDELELRMNSVNVGSGIETIALEQPASAEFTCGLNMDYLAAAVASHPAGPLRLSWSSPTQPIFLVSADPFPVTTVVMPVKCS